MKTVRFTPKIYQFTLLFCFLFQCLSYGNEPDLPDGGGVDETGTVVVTATKFDIDLKESGASVSVITAEQIERSGKRSVADLLREVPGVMSADSGGINTVFIRGAKSGNTLVLIDGVRINDPMNPDKIFDFRNLPTENIERIEIVRGASAALYGSDATGGVINIITRKGKGESKLSLSAEAGSHMTFRENLSAWGGTDLLGYSVSLTRVDSGGISQAMRAQGSSEPEKDRYDSTAFSSAISCIGPADTRIQFIVNYTDTLQEIDANSFTDDPNYEATRKNMTAGLTLKKFFLNWWEFILSGDYTYTQRKDENQADTINTGSWNTWFEGRTRKGTLENHFHIFDIDTVVVGFDYSDETGSLLNVSSWSTTPDEFNDMRVWNTGCYSQNHIRLMDRIFNTTGVRYDHNENFGDNVCWQSALSIIIPVTETRLKGSTGTGFKAPSLYQMYYPQYGNPDLKKEKSFLVDCGFEQPLFDDVLVLGCTFFQNRYTDLINFVGMKYSNTPKVRTRGLESNLAFNMGENFMLNASYTWTLTRDYSTNRSLYKRPEHVASLSLLARFLDKGDASVSAVYTGRRRDVDTTVYPSRDVILEDYVKVDVGMSWWIIPQLQIFGRIENLTNSDYQEVYGYSSAGISFYGGLKGMLM